MRHLFLFFILLVLALPARAEWGLSNVVRKEIHRDNGNAPVEAVQEKPAESPLATTNPPVSPVPVTPAEQPQLAPSAKASYYPYTIHLSSWEDPDEALRHAQRLKTKLHGVIFVTKINLGETGTWYRLDFGAYANIKEAVLTLQKLKSQGLVESGAFVGGQVPYALEIGQFKGEQEAKAKAAGLMKRGVVPYVIMEKGGLFRVLIGAFPSEESAAPALNDLMALGLTPTVKKR